MTQRTSVRDIRKRYEEQTPITVVTCYDFTFARLVEKADLDAVLVGDSLGNVVQGESTTLPVTVEDIIYHTRAVARGTQSTHLIADMPFMSFQADPAEGLRNAGRLLKEGGAQAVKVEGGEPIAGTVEKMTQAGIPVVGHLGLTPQSIHATGGYRVQGRGEEARKRLVDDARALEEAGVYALVLEMVPEEVAREVTETIDVPTIGIGAGAVTSGQVLVFSDLLGLDQSFEPKFVKRYADLETTVVEAFEEYRDEVVEGEFPTGDYSY